MPAATSLTLDDMKAARVGGNLGFTLYAQFGPSPTISDPYLGVFNNAALARIAVTAINEHVLPEVLPWVAMGRLIYPETGMERIDDFIAVMATSAIARWVASAVATAAPPGAHRSD